MAPLINAPSVVQQLSLNLCHVSIATWNKIFNQMTPYNRAGSAKANGREPKTGLGRVFNIKLGCIARPGIKCMVQPLLKL